MMNEFIELRKCIYDENNPYVFPLLFLDDYVNKNKTINLSESIVLKKIQSIRRLELKSVLKEGDAYELLSLLGDNKYLDRFIVDTILKSINSPTKKTIEKIIKTIISKKDYNSQKIYHVLDICIECRLNILEDTDLYFMLGKYKLDLDVLSILIDYLDSFKRCGFKDNIYNLLKREYPDNIKIQLLNLIVELDSVEKFDKSFVKTHIRHEKNKEFYDSYIDFLNSNLVFKGEGISILQSMFYGDFEDSGKGNNGGLAVLLKSLGDQISKDNRLSFVFTITITEKSNKPFISYYGDKHVFIRLPIYMDQYIWDPFTKRELFIKRYIKSFLRKAGIEPDIFHIRYLDNASKAVANLSKELNKKLVFTLTPDPHRNMFDESGNLVKFNFNDFIEKLNKIKIGDELLYKSDGIIGIGDLDVKEELEIYFPQLKEENIKNKIQMIGEGIQIDNVGVEEESLSLEKFINLSHINKDFFERPTILNVGRLSIQKGQIELLKAWSNSKLSDTHNLLIIGGDLEKPSKEEKIIIDFFSDYLEKNPHLKDKFFHKAAMTNENIRSLEKNIIKKDLNYPHIYLCSSIKEEFGIAILEAMSQGYLAMGPVKGGVKSYIKNGKNGFLIHTNNWETIANDSQEYIYNSKIDKKGFRLIQQAGQKTVDENFSMSKIANDFLEFYLSLKGVENDEV